MSRSRGRRVRRYPIKCVLWLSQSTFIGDLLPATLLSNAPSSRLRRFPWRVHGIGREGCPERNGRSGPAAGRSLQTHGNHLYLRIFTRDSLATRGGAPSAVRPHRTAWRQRHWGPMDQRFAGARRSRRCRAHAFAEAPRIRSAAFSAIMMVGAAVFPRMSVGMTDASTMRNRSIPSTFSWESTT